MVRAQRRRHRPVTSSPGNGPASWNEFQKLRTILANLGGSRATFRQLQEQRCNSSLVDAPCGLFWVLPFAASPPSLAKTVAACRRSTRKGAARRKSQSYLLSCKHA